MKILWLLPLIALLLASFTISIMAALTSGDGYWLIVSGAAATGTVTLGEAVLL